MYETFIGVRVRSIWVGKLFHCLYLQLNFSHRGNTSNPVHVWVCVADMLWLHVRIKSDNSLFLFQFLYFIGTSVKCMIWKVDFGGTRAVTWTLTGSAYQVTSSHYWHQLPITNIILTYLIINFWRYLPLSIDCKFIEF